MRHRRERPISASKLGAFLLRGLVLTLAVFNFSCASSETLFSLGEAVTDSNPTFLGCISGTGLSTSSIELTYAVPSDATLFRVKRNGVEIASTTASGAGSVVDSGLNEGHTYTYKCEATIGGTVKTGARIVQASTLAVNAPTFSGITGATVMSSSSVKVKWSPASAAGVPAAAFKVYVTPGVFVDWGQEPYATVAASASELIVSGRSDEVPYSYGVRACSSGGVCDVNVASVLAATSDGGAPTTTGATGAFVREGKVVLTAPWVIANGGILKRRVYHREDTSGGTTLSNYALYQSELVVDASDPPLEIELAGLAEHKTHYFILIDEDPSGNTTAAHAPVSIAVTDLTLPVFLGAASANLGGSTESSIELHFTAIDREAVESASAGASAYVAFAASAEYPGVPDDGCIDGTEAGSFDAAAMSPGSAQSVTISGLQPRHEYSVCLKARDSTGNTSITNLSYNLTTLDETPPLFDGVQSFSLNAADRALSVGWNPSASADVESYRLKVWKNTATPAAGDITTISRPSIDAPDGMEITASDFGFGDYDVVYAIVEACDDAHELPGGVQNCTDTPASLASVLTLPDFVPPAPFGGIRPAADQEANVHGTLLVRWNAPTDWTDYMGFRVYDAASDGTLTLLKACACPAGDCVSPSAYTECTVTGLTPYRTYRLHVRGYDAGGNETQNDPFLSVAEKRVLDTSPPTFSSGLTVGDAPDFTLGYSAATDDQDSTAAITYSIYRKTGAAFVDPADPSADGSLVGTTTATSYTDETLVEGQLYFFTVCASDASGNTTCSGVAASVTVPDRTAPLVTGFSSDADGKKKRWTLSWSMSDNVSATGNLQVRIYQSQSATPAVATNSDLLIHDGNGTTSLLAAGPVDTDTYVNYLLEVTDETGNTSTAAYSVLSKNVISITRVARPDGPDAGGKTIVVWGTGFVKASENAFGTEPVVRVGGADCTGVKVYDSYRLSCVTPPGAAGSAAIEVESPEGSSTLLAAAYSYLAASAHPCDQPGVDLLEMAGGDGSSVDPFVICTPTQFNRIRYLAGSGGATRNYRTGGFYYRVADTIDLTADSMAPIGSFTGTIDGKVFSGDTGLEVSGARNAILNYVLTGVGTGQGLFGTYSWLSVDHLDLLGFEITGTGSTGAAALMAYNVSPGQTVNVSDLHVVAKVSGYRFTGGLVGANYGEVGSLIRVTGTVDVTSVIAGTGGLVAYAIMDVQDCQVSGKVVAPNDSIGGIAGSMLAGSSVSNSSSDAVVQGVSYVGGLIGSFAGPGTVTGLSGSGTVSSTGSYVGGLIGQAGGDITDSRFDGTVTATNTYVGGLVGYKPGGRMERVVNSGSVSGTTYVGGVVGYAECASVHQGGNLGEVRGSWSGAGGIAGRIIQNVGAMCDAQVQPFAVSESFNRGSVFGLENAAGLVGLMQSYRPASDLRIEDSYSSGPITGMSAGSGLVGRVEVVSNGPPVWSLQRLYSASVMSGFSYGVVGVCAFCVPPPTVSGVIWSSELSGAAASYSNYNVGGFVGEPFTEVAPAALTDSAAGNVFESAGYDFSTVWTRDASGYPVLQWESSLPPP